MGNLKSFLVDLTKFGDETEKLVGKITRAKALQVFRDVIQGSPVDTGRFRASWFVGIGLRNEQIEPPRERQKSKTATKSAASATSRERLSILTPGNVTGKDPIYLSNNLPYGPALEAGHSQQAPNGWIDAAVARAQAEVNLIQVEES